VAIRIPIISEFDDKGLARATRQFKDLETTGQKAQFAIQKAAVPATLALGGLAIAAGDAFKAYAEDAAAADKLALSLKNSTDATDEQVAAVEDFISSTSRAAAVADDDLRPALDNLVRGTKDITKAQDLLSLALDVSAGTGKDLDAVTQALSKAYNGQLGPLKKLDPALASLIKSGASADEVFAALGQTFGGQAAAQADTAQGRMKNLSIQMGELKESVGAAVAPIVEKLLPAFQGLTTWMSENTGIIVGLGAVIGGLALAIYGLNAAMAAWRAAGTLTVAINKLLTKEFTQLWVATGVGIILAIIAAIVVLQAKFGLFTPVIDFVKKAFEIWWNTVSAIFGRIYDKISTVVGFFAKGFEIAFDIVSALFNTWWDTVSLIAEKVKGVFEGIGEAIKTAFKTAFNFVAKAWNNTVGKLSFKIPDWVPKLGGKGFSMPQIPELAEGGIVTGPTLAMIGEKGPEAVIPLDRMMGGNITVNVAGSVTSERDLIETIRRGLVNAQRNGAQLVYSNT
jgi:hypothetical protein